MIIDELRDDHDTLRACSLTSRTWLPTTRIHVFRIIRIERLSQQDHYFESSLPTLVDAASYVREFVISGMHGSWSLPPWLCRLEHVTCLTITESTVDAADESIYPRLMAAFPGLQSLHLSGVDFADLLCLWELLRGYPKLSTIHLSHILVNNEQPLDNSLFDTAMLAQITLRDLSLHNRTILNSLARASSSLEHLKFASDILSAHGDSESACLAVVQASRLRTLHLGLLLFNSRDSVLPELALSILSSLDLSRMERIVLDFDLLQLEGLDLFDRDRLNNILSSLVRGAPRLVVEFRATLVGGDAHIGLEIAAYVVDFLAGVREAGLLLEARAAPHVLHISPRAIALISA